MTKLSVIILAHNEEDNIKKCLETVSFTDEIILIDDYSTDKTVEIAKKYGAKIYKRKLDDFASQRNYGLAKATGEWVLFVDADERVTDELKSEILAQFKAQGSRLKENVDGYRIPRKNKIFGKFLKYTDWYPDYQLHLFKKDKGKYVRKVHEQVKVKGEAGKLSQPLVHLNYDSLDQFLQKNYFQYADLEAKRLMENGYKFKWRDLLKQPAGEFLRRFFACRGYKDGLHGLVASILVSFATFVVYAKIWEKEGFGEKTLSIKQINKEFEELTQETRHWLRESKIKEEKNFLKRFFFKIFG